MSERHANDITTSAFMDPAGASHQALTVTAPDAIHIKDEEDEGPKLKLLSLMDSKLQVFRAAFLGDLEPELQQLQNEISIVARDNTLLTKEVAKLNAKNTALEDELKQARPFLDAATHERQILRDKLRTIEQEHDSISIDLDASKQDLAHSAKRLMESQAEAAILRSRKEDLVKKNKKRQKELEDERAALAVEVVTLKNLNDDLNRANACLQGFIERERHTFAQCLEKNRTLNLESAKVCANLALAVCCLGRRSYSLNDLFQLLDDCQLSKQDIDHIRKGSSHFGPYVRLSALITSDASETASTPKRSYSDANTNEEALRTKQPRLRTPSNQLTLVPVPSARQSSPRTSAQEGGETDDDEEGEITQEDKETITVQPTPRTRSKKPARS